MITRVHSAALWGTQAIAITVEAHVLNGLPTFAIVGLPDNAVRESRERVRSAIINSGRDFPPKRITLNLAPADLKKEGGIFDLPISVAVLAGLGYLPPEAADRYLFVGELGLDGSVRPVKGVIAAAFLAGRLGLKGLVCPAENAREALLAGSPVWPVKSLLETVALLRDETPGMTEAPEGDIVPEGTPPPDLGEVTGQDLAKRALEIAAAGFHNLLMVGPPGAGKSMLARRLPSILPELDRDEVLECTQIYSAAGRLKREGIISTRPFRSPHHTITDIGLIGGGNVPTPGEVTLAHNGVLFLDELPEFRRSALEAMRQPLEDGCVTVSRAGTALTFPSRFQLIAAMNPCPCGYRGHPGRECRCTPVMVAHYVSRISGPLLDRVDLHVWVDPVDARSVLETKGSTTSSLVRQCVLDARARQAKRGFSNAHIPDRDLEHICSLDAGGRGLLLSALRRYHLSMRGYTRVIKVARTIADLDGQGQIRERHVAEALQFRPESDLA